MRVRPRTLVRWFIGVLGGALVAIWVVVQVTSRTPQLQQALIQALNDQLDSDVELQSFQVRTFPVVRIHGDGLKLRVKGQQNPTPFIEIAHFDVTGGLFGMLHRQRRFHRVELHGLRITIPPKSPHDREAGKAAASAIGGPVIIDEVVADDAQLVIVPSNPQKDPRLFDIHHLTLESVGFRRSMPFQATLTNPIPQGEINVSGTFGPWIAHDPGASPLGGHYTFDHALLATITGIGGTLSSAGDFGGQLGQIDVRGTTETPDFQLTNTGEPVPLKTRFHVVVDGTSGDTYLKEVEATLQDTAIEATGEITRVPGVKGRTVHVVTTIKDGHVQDVLRLAVSAPKPVMVGRIALDSELTLPPGTDRVAERIQLRGRFALEEARFTDAGVQKQLASLSRRSRGLHDDEPVAPIHSAMSGKFVLKNGVIAFDPLAFDVPGATVRLDGRYSLRSERLDFAGTLGMTAPISKAMGGIKGFFLKPFDPIFRKNGKGASVPITIRGLRSQPKFGLSWGKVFK